MNIKRIIVIGLLFSCNLTEAQISISINATAITSSKLELRNSSNSEPLGSSVKGDDSFGYVLHLNIYKRINDKLNLKLGFGTCSVKKRIISNLSSEFIQIAPSPIPIMQARSFSFNFSEFSIGLSFPFVLHEKIKVNVEISGLAIKHTSGNANQFSSSSSSPLFGESYIQTNGRFFLKNSLSFGAAAGINYAYQFSDLPLSLLLGIIGIHNASNPISGDMQTLSPSNTIFSEIKGNFSYLGFNLGLAYTFNKEEGNKVENGLVVNAPTSFP